MSLRNLGSAKRNGTATASCARGVPMPV